MALAYALAYKLGKTSYCNIAKKVFKCITLFGKKGVSLMHEHDHDKKKYLRVTILTCDVLIFSYPIELSSLETHMRCGLRFGEESQRA